MATLEAQTLAGAKMKCIGTKFIECLFFCVYILVHSMKNKSQLIFFQRQTNTHTDIHKSTSAGKIQTWHEEKITPNIHKKIHTGYKSNKGMQIGLMP